MNKHIGILYMPVFHKGYFDFIADLEKKCVKELYIVSDKLLEKHEELDYLNRKDRLRALPHQKVLEILLSSTNVHVHSLTEKEIETLQVQSVVIHAPHEDINQFLMGTYFKNAEVVYHNVFLRRNLNNVGEEKEPETEELDLETFQEEIFAKVIEESEHSADWWRKVGAALVKDGELIALAHNEHMPEEELPNIEGDARGLYKKGININYVTAAHAEVGVIGEAARRGTATDGAELYLTDFPCPYCARLIAKSGIKRLYFQKGYAVLDGDAFLKEAGIEVLRVKIEH